MSDVLNQKGLLIILRGIFEFLKMICLGKQAGTIYRTNHLFYFVYFGLFLNRSVCFGCLDIDPKHRNKPKKYFIGFAKQTEKQPKQVEFRFVSVRNEKLFCLFRGHPSWVNMVETSYRYR
jgi:hypothetical protein